jgi:hypothetical protein
MTIAQGQPLLASDINNLTFFPKGTILTFSSEAWSATSAEFKNIWKICNGQNGTPNLVDKFLRGGESSNFITPGGADNQSITLKTTNLPSHSHPVIDPGHKHQFKYNLKNASGGVWAYMGFEAQNTGGMYTDDSKTGIAIGATGDGIPLTIDTVPSYYIVIYIMKMV